MCQLKKVKAKNKRATYKQNKLPIKNKDDFFLIKQKSQINNVATH